MFASVLAFAGLWLAVPIVFYALCAILFIVVVVGMSTSDEYDTGVGFWATVGSLGLIAVLGQHFGVTWEGIKNNWILDAIGFGSYFVVGIAWSFVKWYFHLSNVRETYQLIKATFMEKNGVTADQLAQPAPTAPASLTREESRDPEKVDAYTKAYELYGIEKDKLENFISIVDRQMKTYKAIPDSKVLADPSLVVQRIKPEASKHKAAITEWIAFWPISFAWTMLNDPVRKIVNYIFSRIKGTFQRMSDSMFAGV